MNHVPILGGSMTLADLARHYREDHDARAELLAAQVYNILAFTAPQKALDVLRQAIAIERGQGMSEEPEVELIRQATLDANEKFIKACEEIFLPLIAAWPGVFNAPTPKGEAPLNVEIKP